MLGVLYLIAVGLSFQVSKTISNGFSICYKLDGGMLMKIISLGFLVGDGVYGVLSPLEEK